MFGVRPLIVTVGAVVKMFAVAVAPNAPVVPQSRAPVAGSFVVQEAVTEVVVTAAEITEIVGGTVSRDGGGAGAGAGAGVGAGAGAGERGAGTGASGSYLNAQT